MMRISASVAACATLAVGQVKHPIRQSLVDRINARNGGWEATMPEDNPLAGLSYDEIKELMGLVVDNNSSMRPASRLAVGGVPDAFDGRSTFSSCQKAIRDQANCGSCWAFGAAETLTTNLCVLGQDVPILSPQDLISCDSSDKGCNGGTLLNAWDFIDGNGLVSDDCIPYTSAQGDVAVCPVGGCSSSGTPTKYKCPVAHSMLDSDEEIQAAVMVAGAVEVGFYVYEDFMNYKSGIYKHQEGQVLGGHAVKIVGWGHQDSQFFWIVQNSWGASWGENGFFRIANWHDDKDSAIAIGGGFACVQGDLPPAPTPAPTPSQCEDIVSYCSDYDHSKCASTSYIIPVCKKTCGCCDDFAPDYCQNISDVIV